MTGTSRLDDPMATGTVALLLNGLRLDDPMATGTVALLLNGPAHVRGRPTDGLLAPGDLPLNLRWPMVGDSPRAMLGEMLGETDPAGKADGSAWTC